ncbi:crossover junction endodeoxyribonuclease RuvC [Sneathia sp. DSM 16631]|uniref:crossover junction endodeoxyribonuclease RuvC n=1 Tax=Sneathia sp. DSM 16631 TaxID=2777994 RepID=UPI0018666ADC|nr:crossover junction endodeoxyribonuclease RuvC [Sneathia sp. DSM 16631]MBE3031268.1 crossover junction endodeoxyribonuclease RuvC [Sneathia sp. DSM 16631]
MRVLGIDPGTAIVGYSILDIESGKYKLIDYGCIFTEQDLPMPRRLEIIFQRLDTIIKLYKPREVAIEELYFFKNQKTVIKVGQARGVIVLACQMNGLDIFDYTPLQVKMGVTSYGRATKKQIQETVKMILNLDEIPKPDDAADAIAIAITHINNRNIPTTTGARVRKNNFKSGQKISLEEYKLLMNKK